MTEWSDIPLWLSEDWSKSPDSDVVVCSEVKLNRNLSGHGFPDGASAAEKRKMLEIVADALDGLDMTCVDLESVRAKYRQFLAERRLISRKLSDVSPVPFAALHYESDESRSVAVNEEDHVRIRSLRPGFRLSSALTGARTIENILADSFEFAYSPDFGFLTTSYAGSGSGMRLSVLTHIPAVVLMQAGQKVQAYARQNGVQWGGCFGDDTAALGNMFHLYVEPGAAQEEISSAARRLETAVQRLKEEEMSARKKIASDPAALQAIGLSYGTLRYGYSLDYQEAANALSCVVLAAKAGLGGPDPQTTKAILAESMTGHMTAEVDRIKTPLNIQRAAAIRRRLGGTEEFSIG